MGENSAPFKIGDSVRLKSGGPSMTVVQLPPVDLPNLPGELGCTWFEGARLHRKSFPVEALEAASNSQATGIDVSVLLDLVQAARAMQEQRDAESKPKSR
jgi:uncharacterized protein YodC (DUF2158 family)